MEVFKATNSFGHSSGWLKLGAWGDLESLKQTLFDKSELVHHVLFKFIMRLQQSWLLKFTVMLSICNYVRS